MQGSQEIPGGTGKFGLGVQNEAGQRLTEFCQENTLVIRERRNMHEIWKVKMKWQPFLDSEVRVVLGSEITPNLPPVICRLT